MRIKEEFKRSGYFWLPSAPEKRIPGTLSISDGGNIELEIMGLLEEANAFTYDLNLKRIVGNIEKDGLVTLDDCSYMQKIVSFDEISKSPLLVKYVFSGVAYKEGESISFNTLNFSVEGIDEWVEISGIKVDSHYKSCTGTITYQPPETISLNLNNGMQLLIIFSWTIPISTTNMTKAEIAQKTYFKLVSAEERELNDFIAIAHKITTLLCFAIDETVCLDHVTATSNKIRENMTEPVPIRIYYQSQPYSKDKPKIEWDRMLFRYGLIQNDAERIINNWIDAYDEIAPALNLYFSTKTRAQKYLDGKFLALAQGLETYHRRKSNEKLMDEVIFKELVENLVLKCPEEHKEWLKGRLMYGNEINLGKRIKSIIKPFNSVIGTRREREKIIRKIVDTRNYLTHYDESLEAKAASGQDLLSLCFKMEAFFQLHFLQLLGFTQKEIKLLLSDCYQLKHKLNKI
jgi:ApeA N-terminal domain 1